MNRAGWIAAAVVTAIAGAYLIADGAIRYHQAQARAEARALEQWCLSRPRVVDGRCDKAMARLYQSHGPGLWSQESNDGN